MTLSGTWRPWMAAGTVMLWLRKGYLRGFNIGKEWRVSVKDLEDFLESSANTPSSKPWSVA